MQSTKSWLEISEERLRQNYDTLMRLCAAEGRSASVLAVVKARAYGHGAGLCAQVLASAGASWLGVSDAREGALVRRSLNVAHQSRTVRILVMCGPLPEDAATIVANQLTPVVWSADHLDWLSRGSTAVAPLPIHLEIDTGMSRQGVQPGTSLNLFLDCLSKKPQLRLEGILTHFASAEISGSPSTALQRQRFETALTQADNRRLRPEWIHVGNSSTIDEANSLPWLQQIASLYGARSLVRSGLALYGYCLPLENASSALRGLLHPVLSWKSRIVDLHDISPGAAVGYNGTFIAPGAMRLALLPVGYADGLRRELSASNAQPGGWCILHGQRAPIIGRISMNLTTIDVTSIPRATLGDEVTLLGDGITAEDHARIAHTIPYEILCGLRAEPQLIVAPVGGGPIPSPKNRGT